MLILLLVAIVYGRLVGVVEISRNGHRSPHQFMPWDNYQLWPQGPGQLTPEGMRQHYLLGVELRNRYILGQQILQPSYFQPEIYIFSTEYNYTIMSAQSQLQGLFPNGTGPLLRSYAMETSAIPPISLSKSTVSKINSLGLMALPNLTQVVPLHTDVETRQFLLDPWNSCQYYQNLTYYRENSADLQEIFDQYQDSVISVIMNYFGVDKFTAQQYVPAVYDSLVANQFVENPLPQGFNSTFYQNILALYPKVSNFVYREPDILAKIGGTALMTQVYNDLFTMLHGQTTINFFLYSGHEFTIGMVLAFLQLNFSETPSFASTLIFELNQFKNQFYVSLKYNDVYQLIPTCGSYSCNFNDFAKYIEFRMLPNISAVCDFSMQDDDWAKLVNANSTEFNLPGSGENNDFKWFFWVTVAVYIGIVIAGMLMMIVLISRGKNVKGKPDSSMISLYSNKNAKYQ